MRLIDAADAKRTYTADMFDTEEDFERVNDVLDYAPAVDAVVVTRCKNCARYRLGLNGSPENWCVRTGFVQRDDDFCSYGRVAHE